MRANPPTLNAESRRWRTGLLLACAILAVCGFLVFFQGTPILSWCSTTMGFYPENTPKAAGALVTNVSKGGPADVAGLRTGDRIDFRDISFRERWRLNDIRHGWGGLADEHLRYVAHRGSRIVHAIVSPRRIAPTWGTWSDWVGTVSSFWGLFFAALLAARRPDLVEARLLSLVLLFLTGVNALIGLVAPWPIVEFIIQTPSSALYLAVPIICLTVLASRVARPLSIVRRILAFLAIAGAVAFAAEGLVWSVCWFFLALPVYWMLINVLYTVSVPTLASLACAIAAALASRGAERARLFWIAASVSPVWLYYGPFVGIMVLFGPSTNYALQSYLYIPATVAFLLLPIAFTYAVLSRRIVDIGFVLNQAAIFSGVSFIVVGLFVLGEWMLGSWFSQVSHTTNLAISAAMVVGLGFSVRAIHARVEHVLDRMFFRKRHDDEMAIRRFAEEASDATDAVTLVHRAKETLETYADVAFVTLAMADGKGHYGDVSEGDPAITTLKERHKPLDLQTLSTQLPGEFAYPMIARGRLVGALVLGPKRSGESYAPDESSAIMQLAREVGGALHILTLARVLQEHHLPT